jgi:hypothetical protein
VREILKGAIFDHTTLLLPSDRRDVLPQLTELLSGLKERRLKLVVFSTHRRDISRELRDRSLPDVDLFLTRYDIPGRKPKGSPLWITEAAKRLGTKTHELVYVGSDKHDWLTAINSATFYVHAEWVAPSARRTTVLSASQPLDILRLATHFLLLPPRWQYSIEDASNRLYVRSLLRADAVLPATIPPTFTLQQVFTYEFRVKVDKWPARDLLVLHALSSLYVEGRIRPNSWFVVYPGSRPGRISRVLQEFIKPASKLFRGFFKEDLLVRGKPARDSSMARAQARRRGSLDDPVDFTNQSNTVHVNPRYRTRVKDQNVIVFDDFTTTGMSLEWARNLLYAAGAREVILLTIGKYPKQYKIYKPRTHDIIEPFNLKDYDITRDFTSSSVDVVEDGQAKSMLQKSFRLWREGRPFD